MASNQTSNFQLSQWEANDEVLRADFNRDNLKIDTALAALSSGKGNCAIVTGSYVGSGTYGSGNRTVLSFDSPPAALFVASGWQFWAVRGADTVSTLGGSNGADWLTLSWEGSQVSWYSTRNAVRQLNEAGTTYFYIALTAQEA